MATKTKQQELEAVRYYEDALDNTLYECMEIAKLPPKWGMDLQGTMIEIFPHPIVNRGCTKVIGIEYKTQKSYLLPELLLDRLAVLENEIANASRKSVRDGKAKAKKAKSVAEKKVKVRKPVEKKAILGRPTKYSSDDIEMWAGLKEHGYSYREIAEMVQVKESTLSNYVRKYIKRYAKEVAQ